MQKRVVKSQAVQFGFLNGDPSWLDLHNIMESIVDFAVNNCIDSLHVASACVMLICVGLQQLHILVSQRMAPSIVETP